MFYENVINLLYEYFLKPIETYSGYNPINTITYAAILIFVAFKLIFPWLRKNWKIDYKFALSLLGYIIFGCSFRVLEDMQLLPRSSNPLSIYFYTVSPGIWIFVGLLTIFCLFLSKKIAKATKHSAENIFMLIGFFLALPFLLFDIINFKELLGLLLVFIFISIIVLVIFSINKKEALCKNSMLNFLTIFSHVFDSSVTFVAVSFFNCWEQHFLPRIILQINPLLFPLIKVFLVILLVRLADDLKEKELASFVKIVVFILGFSTGFRDLLTLSLGICS